MKKIITLIVIGFTTTVTAQIKETFIFKQYSPEISFIVMDSIHVAQSMIIEYPKYLVVVEAPIIDAGGGKAHDLNEDSLGTEKFINYLSSKFPRKPIKYVLSSHWHQHSLSGVSSFINNGAKIVTTKQNWNYAISNGLLSESNLKKAKSSIIEINKDSVLLANSENPIKVLYLDSTYKNKPTKDYLFFFLTKKAILHASCMGAINNKDLKKEGDYIYGERLIDLFRLVNEKKIKVDKLVSLSREDCKDGEFEPGIYNQTFVESFYKKGKSAEEVMKPFTEMSNEKIALKSDSIIMEIDKWEISVFAVKAIIFECIRNKELEKALLLAKIAKIYFPSYFIIIDMLGEAYFLNNNLALAKYFSETLLKSDPKWSGGIKVWEENKKLNKY